MSPVSPIGPTGEQQPLLTKEQMMSTTHYTKITITGDIRNVINATKELGGEVIRGKGHVELYTYFQPDAFHEFGNKHFVTLQVVEGCCDEEWESDIKLVLPALAL
jgi:hypothetical protein